MDSATAKPSTHLREILNKTTRPRHEPETEDAESLKASRPHMQAPMLDVVFRNGKIRSFSYIHLSEVDFAPGDTITMKFSSGASVVIEGRGLAYHRQQSGNTAPTRSASAGKVSFSCRKKGFRKWRKSSSWKGICNDAGNHAGRHTESKCPSIGLG